MSENIKMKNISITSPFWQRYRRLISNKSVWFQWKMISDKEKPQVVNSNSAGGAAESSGAINNLEIAAGLANGHHNGMVFQDTDVYKWLETVAYVLKYQPSEKLRNLADKVIDLIYKAQDEDGYLSTRYQIDKPALKFKQLQQSHELYSMGHYIEAGIAYYMATSNTKALEIAKRMANCIDDNFGLDHDKVRGYDGHPEIELALAKLYECTKEEKYLKLANYFVNIRGNNKQFFKLQNKENNIDDDPFPEMRHASYNYFFDERPIYNQKMAQGHAVRVLYYLTGVAYVARLTNDTNLKNAAFNLWDDIAEKQMYITGNVGQTANGEAFTYDYDLPNLTDYGETCASVAMIMFSRQLLEGTLDSRYGDIIEKELYNGALAGISLDGEHYFYANPLEISNSSKLNPASSHLSSRRLSWFSCACCPANITRLIASVDKYIYLVKSNLVVLDQLISNTALFTENIQIDVKSELPWGKRVKIKIKNPNKINFYFKIRIPSWSENYSISVNEKHYEVKDNYITVNVDSSFSIEIDLDNSVKLMHANPQVVADQGKVAIQCGPIVYCYEEVDNKGKYSNYLLPKEPIIESKFEKNLLQGIKEIEIVNAKYREGDELYSNLSKMKTKRTKMCFVPYYAWANREQGSMAVWIRKED